MCVQCLAPSEQRAESAAAVSLLQEGRAQEFRVPRGDSQLAVPTAAWAVFELLPCHGVLVCRLCQWDHSVICIIEQFRNLIIFTAYHEIK